MSASKIELKAEVSSRVGASARLVLPGDAVLVTRGAPRWLLLRCPCGCGEEIPVNLDARAGKAWRLYKSDSTGLTLFPSVWRDTGCESHFVVWRDRILMFGGSEGTWDSVDFDIDRLGRRVLETWPRSGFASYVDIADVLREIPWDVQEVCRRLARKGKLVEDGEGRRGWYRRAV